MVHISPREAFLLVLPTILWAANAVAGRLAVGAVSPILLNTLRWTLAALILLPLGWRVFRQQSSLWSHLKRFALLGLLGVGCYNALLYLALQTSTPINVTLIGASMPIWMLLIGALFYQEHPRLKQVFGALLSLVGVAVVLTRGDLSSVLQVRFVVGDLFMLMATILWAFYSWMLSRPGDSDERSWPWAQFLLAQVVMGIVWSIAFTGIEALREPIHIDWNFWTVMLLLYVAIGPSIIAYRCWGLGVQALGPSVAAFFANLIPFFTAIMSAALLGELPQVFHGIAFICIVFGILISSQKKR